MPLRSRNSLSATRQESSFDWDWSKSRFIFVSSSASVPVRDVGKTLLSSHDASTLNRALRCRYKFQNGINSDLRSP